MWTAINFNLSLLDHWILFPNSGLSNWEKIHGTVTAPFSTLHCKCLQNKLVTEIYETLLYQLPSLLSIDKSVTSQSRWPCSLRHVQSSNVRTLGSWVQIPLKVLMCVTSFCVVLSCVSSGLATGQSSVQGVQPNVQKQIHKFQK
jgi:hypothetical protein